MKNIVVVFLNFNFLFFILFFPYYFFFYPYNFLFFPYFFLLHTRTLTLFFSFFPFFSLPLSPNSRTFHKAVFLSLSFLFIFFLPFSLFSYHFVHKFLSLYPIKTHKLKDHTQPHHLILIKRR